MEIKHECVECGATEFNNSVVCDICKKMICSNCSSTGKLTHTRTKNGMDWVYICTSCHDKNPSIKVIELSGSSKFIN